MRDKHALPPPQSLLRQFAQRHGLKFTELVSREEVAIRSSSIANILVTEAYAHLDENALTDPAVGLLLNLLHRNFEHVEAAIVTFVSGSGSSAEVISRASVESSVNILYILAGNRSQRLFAFFEHYLREVDRQIRNWRVQIGDLTTREAAIHHEGIAKRQAANDALRQLVQSLNVNPQELWPSTIDKRFQAIGEAVSYRTIYARMSSETHADAEETLRYFVGRLSTDRSLLEAMALETVWTTRLYFYYATLLFLRASIAYANSYSLGAVRSRLEIELADIEKELAEISTHIGSGLV